MSKILPVCLFLLIVVIIVIPAALVRGCRTALPAPEIDRSPIVSPAGETTLRVFRVDKNESAELALEEYLVGVVAAEMPASFDLEALKAQAVVARTYTVNQLRPNGSGCKAHPDSDICTDSTHCQAWESEEASIARWPAAEAAAHLNKIRRAVRETAGVIATYDGRPIDAVFHSCCGGHTEDSENVWVSALPYMRGVPCGYCDGSRWWQTDKIFSSAEFTQALLPYVSVLPVSASGRPLLEVAKRSPSGRVLILRVAGESIRGRDFRSALGLPSTNFSWQIKGDTIIFTARGYGHGVGLCQYGADGQARAGKGYDEIVRSYYSGVLLIPMTQR